MERTDDHHIPMEYLQAMTDSMIEYHVTSSLIENLLHPEYKLPVKNKSTGTGFYVRTLYTLQLVTRD